MSRFKDLLLAGLASTSLVLAIVLWRQHGELEQLRLTPRTGARAASAVTIHAAKGDYVGVIPPAATAHLPEEFRAAFDGDDMIRRRPTTPPEPRARRTRGLAKLVENPEFLHALGVHRQAIIDARFAQLFRRLNLREDELAAFKQLLADKENVALDVVAISENAAEGPLPLPALREGIRRAQAQVEDAIEQSLGSERYALYRDYERSLAHRATVAQLEQRLSYAGQPLTPAQSESLVKILVDATPREADPGVPAVSIVVAAGTGPAMPILPAAAPAGRVTDDAVAQARSLLLPEQLTALRDIQVEQQAAIRAAELVRASIGPGDSLKDLGLMLLLQ